jgi:predicted HTH transcriptional regulator
MHWHALPVNWYLMEYVPFLDARRNLMAKLIREAYEHMSTGEVMRSSGQDVPVADLLGAGETTRVEFKSTLRLNLHTKQSDKKMEHSCLKTIAAFLNAQGGHLIIGINDSGEVLGTEQDGFPNEDKMNLHLVNLIRDRLGPQHMLHIEPRFDAVEGKRVLVVRCKPSNIPVYLKDGNTEQFFARTGAATTELLPSQIQAYIQGRF